MQAVKQIVVPASVVAQYLCDLFELGQPSRDVCNLPMECLVTDSAGLCINERFLADMEKR
jgi:hypothetical protein